MRGLVEIEEETLRNIARKSNQFSTHERTRNTSLPTPSSLINGNEFQNISKDFLV